MKKLPKLLNTPTRVVIAVGAIVLATELFIMTIIHDAIAPLNVPDVYWNFIDTILLTLIVSPALYFLVFRKMHESEERYRNILQTSMDCFWIVDTEGRILDVNDAYCQLTGYTREELLNMHVTDVEAKEASEETTQHIHKVLTKGYDRFDTQHRHKDGQLLDIEVSVVYRQGTEGGHFFVFLHDITERKQAALELARAYAENKWLQRFIDLTPDIAYSIGLDGCLQRWNAALEQFCGLTPDEMKGRPCLEFVCDQDKPVVEADVQKVFANGFHANIYRFIRSDGALIPFHCNGTAIYNEHGEPDGFVGLGRDMSERLEAEEEIRDLAFHDTLTQLPNRRLLNDRLGQTLAASKRSGRYGALMFMDLDNFKPLNDAHGHGVGDLLLIEVARRISSCVREVDTVARFGGDEFVVILSELDTDKTESLAQADIVAEKIRAILAEPYVLTIQQEGKAETITVEYHCTSSIGVVLFIGYESRAEDILKWADMAMYQAKEGGRNLIRLYDSKA